MIVIIGHLVLIKTLLGRHWIGIGTNQEAVRLACINPYPSKLLVFVLMGFLAGFGALLQVPRLEATDPNGGGLGLHVVAAAAERGVAVPEQLAAVGFDDTDPVQFVHATLTRVAQNTRKFGQLTT